MSPGITFATLALLVSDPSVTPSPCTADALALLTIDEIEAPVVPVIDTWQILWDGALLSDHQLAALAGDGALIDRTRVEMDDRPIWVFVGMAAAALGTAASSLGWVLLGGSDGNAVPLGLSLPLALGGLAVGAGGVVFTTRAIQTPLEPHIAPTPSHRLSRDEARRLVVAVNHRLIARCESAQLNDSRR